MPKPFRNQHDPAVKAGQQHRAIDDLKKRPSGLLTVQDEGIALPNRDILNFVGDAVSASDDPVNLATVVDITSALAGVMTWAVFFGSTTNVTAPGVQELIFDGGIVASTGAGWALSDSDQRIETGDTGKYLVFAFGEFINTLSTSKTISFDDKTAYWDGAAWNDDYGVRAFKFNNAVSQPTNHLDGTLGEIVGQGFYSWNIGGATNGSIRYFVVENDTGNLVAWSGHYVVMLRLSSS